jgi:hypothetical protein
MEYVVGISKRDFDECDCDVRARKRRQARRLWLRDLGSVRQVPTAHVRQSAKVLQASQSS